MKKMIVDLNDKPLPEPYQSLAQKRKSGPSHVLADPDCFNWNGTPEGSRFWNEVCRGRSPSVVV